MKSSISLSVLFSCILSACFAEPSPRPAAPTLVQPHIGAFGPGFGPGYGPGTHNDGVLVGPVSPGSVGRSKGN